MNKQEIIKNLATIVSRSEKPFLLFSGPSGSGKTWSAELLAKLLGYKVVTSFSELDDTSTMYEKQPVLVMLDELQGKKKNFQEVVLEKMNQIESSKGKYKCFDPTERVVSIKQVIVVIATTDKHKILDPIVRRCTVIDYPEYNKKEIKEIVENENKKIDKTIIQKIVDCCKLDIRTALSMAEQYKVFKNFEQVLDVRCLDEFGLTRNEEKYLMYLKMNGSASVDALTSILSLPSNKELVFEIEPYFKKMGWVDTLSKGRNLTKQGKVFVEQFIDTFKEVSYDGVQWQKKK